MEWISNATAWVLPVVLAITLHEAAHGWVAEKFGDDTARRLGRVTFNPLKHIDKFGTVVFPGLLFLMNSPILFGYAKPVPVDFHRLRPLKPGMIAVALAGVTVNLILAIASALLLHLEAFISPEQAPWLYMNLYRSLMINCVLIVFNLIPVLPLDGGRVVDALLSGKPKEWFGKLEKYGILIVLAILIIPTLLGMDLAETIIGMPTFWLVEHIMWLTGHVQAS